MRKILLLLGVMAISIFLFGGELPSVHAQNCRSETVSWHRTGPIDVAPGGGSRYCFTITDIPDYIEMLLLETHVDAGEISIEYRIERGDDWYPLTFEPVEAPDSLEYLPYTFGSDSIQVRVHYNAGTQAEMYVSQSELLVEVEDVGTGSSRTLDRAPGKVRVTAPQLFRFYTYRIPIGVTCPGEVFVRATFSGGSDAVSVYLSSDYDNIYGRVETEASPVTYRTTLTQEDLIRANYWQIVLVNWDDEDAVGVTIDVETPDGCAGAGTAGSSGSGPDLIIASLTMARGGDEYCVVIRNIGTAPANLDGPTNENHDNVGVQALVSDDRVYGNGDQPAGGTIIGVSPLGRLGANETFEKCFNWTDFRRTDEPYLVVTVDSGDVVAESNENNNAKAVRIP